MKTIFKFPTFKQTVHRIKRLIEAALRERRMKAFLWKKKLTPQQFITGVRKDCAFEN